MDPRPGNGTATKAVAPKDRRIPLAYVEFKLPVQHPDFKHPLRYWTKGEKPDREAETPCPKLFFDPELQAVILGEDHYPIHQVVKYRRAKAA